MSKFRFIVLLALAFVAGGLLLASLRLPLWQMRMEAPQYRAEEALKVSVQPGSLSGDLNEIKVLNKYIGVTIPEVLPQTRWLPTALVTGAVLGLVAVLLPLRIRRWAAFGIAGSLCAAMLVAAGEAQFQMYHIGHDRDRKAALLGVHDFTPPLLGHRKLAQFDLDSQFGLGAFAIAGAVGLYTAIGFAVHRKELALNATERRTPAPKLQPIGEEHV